MLHRLGLLSIFAASVFACSPAAEAGGEASTSALDSPDDTAVVLNAAAHAPRVAPAVTWTGMSFLGVAKGDGLVATRYDNMGRAFGDPISVMRDPDAKMDRFEVAHCGDQTAIAFEYQGGISLVRVGLDGTPSAPQTLAAHGERPHIASDGVGTCMVTYLRNDDVRMGAGLIIDRTGHVLRAAGFFNDSEVKVAHDGTEYVVAWVNAARDVLAVGRTEMNEDGFGFGVTSMRLPIRAELVEIAATQGRTYVAWYAGHELRGSVATWGMSPAFLDETMLLASPQGDLLASTKTYGDTEGQLAVAAHPSGEFTIATSRALAATEVATLRVGNDGRVGPVNLLKRAQEGSRIALAPQFEGSLLLLENGGVTAVKVDSTGTPN